MIKEMAMERCIGSMALSIEASGLMGSNKDLVLWFSLTVSKKLDFLIKISTRKMLKPFSNLMNS